MSDTAQKAAQKTAQRIEKFRTKKGLSLEKAAEKLGVSAELLADWEAGKTKPDTETVLRMARLYGQSPEMILYGEDARGDMQTMFPKTASPAFSPFAGWSVLAGALIMFAGLGGALLVLMRAARFVGTLSAMIEFCGKSLVIFGGIFALGAVIFALSAFIRYKKHKNKK